jgi:hypothetical protein
MPIAEETQKWLEDRKIDALAIDPDTAEVMWDYRYVLDPYCVYSDLSPEEKQIGRSYFARRPGSDVWIWFGDLPADTRAELLEMHENNLAFPAGLPFFG